MPDGASFERSTTAPTDSDNWVSMSADNQGTIKMWVDGNTVKWYSDYPHVYASPVNTTNLFMFDRSEKFKRIDLTGIDFSKCTTLHMFNDNMNVETIDMSGIDVSNVTGMGGLFHGLSKLKTVYVSNDFNTSNVTFSDNMFDGCTSIVGGEDTTYDENHTDISYAHVDGGTDNPGYFTLKQ